MAKETKNLLAELREPSEISIPDAGEALRAFLPALHAMIRQAGRLVELMEQSELTEKDRALLETYEAVYQKAGALVRLGGESEMRFRQMIRTFREIGDLLNGRPREAGDGKVHRIDGLRQKAEKAGYEDVWPEGK